MSYMNRWVLPFMVALSLGAGSVIAQQGAATIGNAATIRVGNGTAAAPSFSFTNEPGSGLYRVGAGDISLQVLGVSRFEASTTQSLVRGSDGGAYFFVANGQVSVNSGGLALLNGGAGAAFVFSTTAPTVTSAGTAPSVTSSNGSATFRVNVGTGGVATTIVLALPSATTGWNCNGSNITAAAANRNPTGALLQQSSTASAATMQYQTVATGVALAFVASDIVQIGCAAF